MEDPKILTSLEARLDSNAVGYVSTVANDYRFGSLSGIVMLSDDSILVADAVKHCIWRVDSSQGGVTIFAGTPGWQGFKDGCVDQARFRFPVGLCTEGPSVFVTDNSGIRQIAGGIVSTIFGKLSYSDHEPDSFGSLTGIALMPCGDIVIADNYPSGSTVCSIGCERQVTTVAGHKQRWNDPVKQSEWSCKDAQFSSLQQIAVGNDGSIYVTDCGNKRLKKIANGKVKTILQSSSSFQGVAIDTDGNLFVSESGTNKIFKWMPSGEVHVLCGSGKEESRDGHGVSASLKGPCYLYYDAKSGCLFFTEERAIRKVKVSEKRHHIDPKLPHDLLKLIDSSDIPSAEAANFLVEGKIVRVAKTSLCIRSEYFQKMLQSDWKESQTEESGNAITVRETTYDAFHAVITFLVAGVFDKEKCHSIMMDVLLLADKYLVADLREICMRQLVKQLSLTTVVEFLLLSEKHDFKVLMDASLTFAAENIKQLRHQDSFDSLSKDIVSKVVLSL
eukprot:m.261352 g.261352  ORF g.261352 m.261352 type:complete len:503 (+) comp40445_c0_seq17:1-1509(+)